jgi:hypothetical protein
MKSGLQSGKVTRMPDSLDDQEPEDQEPLTLLPLADLVGKLPTVQAAKKLNTLSPIHRRLIEPIADDDERLAYQHTIFCQTGLPYRDPGDDVREWKRKQGAAVLQVQAGEIADPTTQDLRKVGLPWGTKPRLILAHLNAEALRQGSPEIEIESSLSAFVRRIRGFKHGREIRMFKDQLTRLSASNVRLALFLENRALQVNSHIVTAFDLWPEKDERQRVLWPSTIKLSLDYWESLKKSAVPLPEADLAALAHSALALDLFAWLAHRLRRIDPKRPAFISWAALKQQFGPDYGRMDNFKRFFRAALRQVHARYQAARFEIDGQGMKLFCSSPPVEAKRLVLLPKSD